MEFDSEHSRAVMSQSLVSDAAVGHAEMSPAASQSASLGPQESPVSEAAVGHSEMSSVMCRFMLFNPQGSPMSTGVADRGVVVSVCVGLLGFF